MTRKPLAIALSLSTVGLIGCGGGGSSSSPAATVEPSTKYNVTAIDGYLNNAQVWLDLNNNHQLDANEPSATSGKGGKATLDVTGIANPEQFSVVVRAIKGTTIDEDKGNTVIADYLMSAPAGVKEVTPLTTLVHVKLSDSLKGLSESQKLEVVEQEMTNAVQSVAADLGINEERVLGDFIAKGHTLTAFSARSLVTLSALPTTSSEMSSVFENNTSFLNAATTASGKIQAAISTPNFDANTAMFNSRGDIDVDSDSDGIANGDDAFVNDKTEWLDSDKDGIGDNADTDDDNDSVLDTHDEMPFDPAESKDSDKDGIGDNADLDDDNDGTPDLSDAFPTDPKEIIDSDSDGTGNNADLDDDNDGVADTEDVFPLNASEWLDSDKDNIGNNADPDDDNDGVVDAEDAFPYDAQETADFDGDGIGNNADTDDDNDGVLDQDDHFPFDPTETVDTDSDGIGDNKDEDDNGDGIVDFATIYTLESDFIAPMTATLKIRGLSQEQYESYARVCFYGAELKNGQSSIHYSEEWGSPAEAPDLTGRGVVWPRKPYCFGSKRVNGWETIVEKVEDIEFSLPIKEAGNYQLGLVAYTLSGATIYPSFPGKELKLSVDGKGLVLDAKRDNEFKSPRTSRATGSDYTFYPQSNNDIFYFENVGSFQAGGGLGGTQTSRLIRIAPDNKKSLVRLQYQDRSVHKSGYIVTGITSGQVAQQSYYSDLFGYENYTPTYINDSVLYTRFYYVSDNKNSIFSSPLLSIESYGNKVTPIDIEQVITSSNGTSFTLRELLYGDGSDSTRPDAFMTNAEGGVYIFGDVGGETYRAKMHDNQVVSVDLQLFPFGQYSHKMGYVTSKEGEIFDLAGQSLGQCSTDSSTIAIYNKDTSAFTCFEKQAQNQQCYASLKGELTFCHDSYEYLTDIDNGISTRSYIENNVLHKLKFVTRKYNSAEVDHIFESKLVHSTLQPDGSGEQVMYEKELYPTIREVNDTQDQYTNGIEQHAVYITLDKQFNREFELLINQPTNYVRTSFMGQSIEPITDWNSDISNLQLFNVKIDETILAKNLSSAQTSKEYQDIEHDESVTIIIRNPDAIEADSMRVVYLNGQSVLLGKDHIKMLDDGSLQVTLSSNMKGKGHVVYRKKDGTYGKHEITVARSVRPAKLVGTWVWKLNGQHVQSFEFNEDKTGKIRSCPTTLAAQMEYTGNSLGISSKMAQ